MRQYYRTVARVKRRAYIDCHATTASFFTEECIIFLKILRKSQVLCTLKLLIEIHTQKLDQENKHLAFPCRHI